MNLAHLHLLLNHWPIIGGFLGLGLLLVALISRSEDLKHASFGLFALLALIGIPAYLSGHAAEDAIKEIPGVSKALVQSHEGVALLSFAAMEITGILSLIAMWRFARSDRKGAGWHAPAVFLFAVITAGLMAVTGNTGGDIRHPEILDGAEPVSSLGTLGMQWTKSIEWFAIESSRWVWPGLEALHFIGLILLLATFGALNLRILGFFKKLPVAPLHRFIPWGIAGLVINVITGFFFFIGMPFFYVNNAIFQWKIVAILVAGANILLSYCTGVFRSWEKLGPDESAPPLAKLLAASSLLLWIAVVIIGRYIPLGE